MYFSGKQVTIHLMASITSMKYSETKLSELAKSSAAPFAVLSHDGGTLDKRNTYEFRKFIQRRFGTFISSMNKKAAVRRRKHIDTLFSMMQDRGKNCQSMNWDGCEAFTVKLDNYDAVISRKCGKGLFVFLKSVNFCGTDLSLIPYYIEEHVSASEEDICDLLEMFDQFLCVLNDTIASVESSMRHQALISEIGMPVIETKVRDFMQKKGISNYNLFIDNQGKTVLEVRIIDQYWMSNDSLNLENADRILGIIPYLLKRPDRIQEDGLGFRKVAKYFRR